MIRRFRNARQSRQPTRFTAVMELDVPHEGVGAQEHDAVPPRESGAADLGDHAVEEQAVRLDDPKAIPRRRIADLTGSMPRPNTSASIIQGGVTMSVAFPV